VPADVDRGGVAGADGGSVGAGADAAAALRALLAGPAHEVAPRLLGGVIRCGRVAVRLTEVEAYAGEQDPGSHAFRGRTRRNGVMFGPPGRLYAYFTYGMHTCANIVCGPEGEASAVLLRAGRVVDGLDEARARRTTSRSDDDLARGPARLCVALGITLDDDGAELLGRDPVGAEASGEVAAGVDAGGEDAGGEDAGGGDAPDGMAGRSGLLTFEPPAAPVEGVIASGRTGVSGEGGRADRYPWRFAIADDPTVSPYRAHAPRTRARSAS